MSSKTHAAINFLYQTLGQKILKFILKRSGGDLEAAEAVLQDTFIAAFKSFHTFHRKSTYFTWLCKIALNKLADYYRHQVHRRSRFVIPTINQLNSVIDPAISPEEKLALDELKAKVNACLGLLPLQYRRLLHLKYYEELSTREICLRLNLTPRSMEGKLYRAKKLLRRLYAKSYSRP
jgi:RNA polymerase sigma-70 factor (ECF subfamily)